VTDHPDAGQDEESARRRYPREDLEVVPDWRTPRHRAPGTGVDDDGDLPDDEDDEILPL
jgi:hypothetical protein